jgi:hypothetical protein
MGTRTKALSSLNLRGAYGVNPSLDNTRKLSGSDWNVGSRKLLQASPGQLYPANPNHPELIKYQKYGKHASVFGAHFTEYTSPDIDKLLQKSR